MFQINLQEEEEHINLLSRWSKDQQQHAFQLNSQTVKYIFYSANIKQQSNKATYKKDI